MKYINLFEMLLFNLENNNEYTCLVIAALIPSSYDICCVPNYLTNLK